MSKIKVNEIEAQSGSTITIPTGQSLVVTDGMNVSNLTGTLPVSKGGTGLTSLGTANQVLRTNSGATALEFADAEGGGKIGQVLQTVKTSTFTTTNGVSGSGFTAVPGLSVSITPSATSSKILVMPTFNLSNTSRSYSKLYINGSESDFKGDAIGSATRQMGGYYTGGSHTTFSISLFYLHSPNSTSQQTYAIYVCGNQGDGTNTTYVNKHDSSSGASAADETSVSSITVMEVLA